MRSQGWKVARIREGGKPDLAMKQGWKVCTVARKKGGGGGRALVWVVVLPTLQLCFVYVV